MDNKKREEISNEFKWDLSKMFSSIEELESATKDLKELVDKVKKYQGKIMESSTSLLNFYKDYEVMERLLEKIVIYSRLLCDTDTSNSSYQELKMKNDKISEDISNELSFIKSEMLDVDYDKVLKYIEEEPKLEEYRFDLEQTFRYKEHVLSKELESIITKANNTFGTGYEVFYNFDNADINLGYIKDEEGNSVELTNSNYVKYMNSKNREVRKNAFTNMYKYFKSFKNTIAASLKGNIKENFFESDVHKFNSPIEESLFSDNINLSVYNSLIDSIHKGLPKMYEYMELRKKALNLDELHMYDIYVDIIDSIDIKIPFEEGKKILFEALAPLGDQYIKDLDKPFEDHRIDIYPNKGKKSGAYSWGCYDSYPYLLLNYNDTIDSVSTMGHELGHSMHSYYSDNNQTYINHNYPIFLAEIASTVNEVLINDYLYKHAKTKEEKILYLTEFLEKVRTTIYRQTMFAEFEKRAHDYVDNGGVVTSDYLNNMYYELNKDYFGNNVVVDENIKYEWLRIPHFYSPFYVYQYATSLSIACYVAENILNGTPGFKEKYLELLKAGGKDYPLELLKIIDINLDDTKVFDSANNMFNKTLDEFIEIYEK